MTPLILPDFKKQQIRDLGKVLLNIPYGFGAKIPIGAAVGEALKMRVDCSGLVRYILGKVGYNIPDGSNNQYDASTPIDDMDIQVGDLVFKRHPRTALIDHVALVMAVSPVVIVEANGWERVYKTVLTPFDMFTRNKVTASQYAGARRLLLERIRKIS